MGDIVFRSDANGDAPLSRGSSTRTLDPEELPTVLDEVARAAASSPGIDAWEVRAEVSLGTTWTGNAAGTMERVGTLPVDGVSVRVFAQGAASYAFTMDVAPERIREMVDRAVASALAAARREAREFDSAIERARHARYAPDVAGTPTLADTPRITELFARAMSAAREREPEASFRPMFRALDRRVMRADSAGSQCDVRTLTSTLLLTAALTEGGRVGNHTEWRGGERGTGDYEDQGGPEALGAEAALRAREYAQARKAPAGRVRVLVDNHLAGLLAHESFGHLTEFDLVASGWSALAGHRGESFAPSGVSIVDAPVDPTARRQGVAIPFDDEGTPGEAVRLLDRGRLTNFLHVRGSAGWEHDAPAGNGRALNVRFPAIVRMRNTYIEPGDMDLDEALKELGDGVYLIGGRGGMPSSDGSFVFTSQRGYLVENGEKIAPLRACAISGNVFDFLNRIEGLTRDFALKTTAFGGCGKRAQSFLHVGYGGPQVLVSEALVGGEAA